MSLVAYKKKRNFRRTPEPSGKPKASGSEKTRRFVVQLHHASKAHFDLRLEIDGTMKSWAVPKGPSLNPLDRRLAVEVEDHPIEYCDFEGIIPAGNYGAGTVMIWDEGTFTGRGMDVVAKTEEEELRRGLARGHLTFLLSGQKLQGEFALVRLPRADTNTWLLLKKHDAFISRAPLPSPDVSARTGRTMEEITATAVSEQKIWAPKGTDTKAKKKTPVRAKAAKASVKLSRLPGAHLQLEIARQPLQKWSRRSPRHDLNTGVGAPRACALFDGYRAQILVKEGAAQIFGLTGQALTKKFPEIVAEFSTWLRPALFDGLVVPLTADGLPRPRGAAGGQNRLHYAFYAYDLLHLDNYDLKAAPLSNRLNLLASLKCAALKLPPDLDADTPLPPGAIGSLVRDEDSGAAFIAGSSTPKSAQASATDLIPHSFTLNTHHQILNRTGVGAKNQARYPASVPLTNLSKIYWPKGGSTKGDLIDYYREVGPVLVPHLIDRPQSLNRHPNGVEGKNFFQKEVAGLVPAWMPTATIASERSGKTTSYLLCQDPACLLYMANLGCIELNPWLSRLPSLNEPDYVVFDLDPAQIDFRFVIEAARTLHKLLDKIEAPSFCKTSGSRGLHIYVPVQAKASYEEVRAFAELACRELHRLLPATTSMLRSPAQRQERIYLDYLQNRNGQTTASVYCVRPRSEPTVSTPLRWSEVKVGLDPGMFTIKTVPRRLDKLGDLWPLPASAAAPVGAYRRALDEHLKQTKS